MQENTIFNLPKEELLCKSIESMKHISNSNF